MSHVYMLRCRDGSYYVGSTSTSLDVRIAQHRDGAFGGDTSDRRPVELVWSEEFRDRADAHAAERRLKGWSRAKKEALIVGDFNLVSALSRRRGGKI